MCREVGRKREGEVLMLVLSARCRGAEEMGVRARARVCKRESESESESERGEARREQRLRSTLQKCVHGPPRARR